MVRLLLTVALVLISFPATSQDSSLAQKLLPPGVNNADYFGNVLAVIAFCNLHNPLDRYELGAAMRFFGVKSADRKPMEAVRDKQYEFYRREFTTPGKHQDFCAAQIKHPLISKMMRSGYHSLPGSDYRRQSEKIEFFGDMYAAVSFCKISIDVEKWASFLLGMGVQSESMRAMEDRVEKRKREFAFEYGTPQSSRQMCDEMRANPTVINFTKK